MQYATAEAATVMSINDNNTKQHCHVNARNNNGNGQQLQAKRQQSYNIGKH